MKKWHHGHSLGVGALCAFAIAQRPAIVFLAGVLVGMILLAVFRVGRRVAGTVAHAMTSYAARETKRRLRERRLAQLSQGDEIPF